MVEKLLNVLKKHGITLASPIALKDCIKTREYKLKNAGFNSYDELFAIIMAVPYLTRHSNKNLSSYAVPRDYHGYFTELFDKVIPELKSIFPNAKFAGFADNSPIDERHAAALAGLGVIGENGMLLTEKYSSYVFLGEIITDLHLPAKAHDLKKCLGCGRCLASCPKNECGQCLSELTQKKGELSDSEAEAILKHGSVWGCDICQAVCPYTLRAIQNQTVYTDIEYFKNNCIPYLTTEILSEMSDEEFAKRAYSWRKRETISRNLALIESNEHTNN